MPTVDTIDPSELATTGQGYVIHPPTTGERITREILATLGGAVLLLLCIGVVRLVPVVGETAPGSAEQTALLVLVYPVLRLVDLGVARLTARRRPWLHGLAVGTVYVAATGLLLGRFLAHPAGTALALVLGFVATVVMLRANPRALM